MQSVVLIYSHIFFCYMNILAYLLFFSLSVFQIFDTQQIDDSVINALKSNNGKELSKFFNSSVRVSIHREEQVATKFQAELIISDYLNDNRLTDIKKSVVPNEGISNCLFYDAIANKKRVRIMMKIVKLKSSEYISEIRVE